MQRRKGKIFLSEGSVRWSGYQTWYASYGESKPGALPLLVAHGGPGMTHDYLLSLTQLADDGRQIVFYDQIGNGKSTHLPGTTGDTTFWRPELFLQELAALIAHLGFGTGMHFLGQSWGGMLGIEYAVLHPHELTSLILADSPSSMPTWSKELATLRDALPAETRRVLDENEAAGTTDSPEYANATFEFYQRHLCRLDPWPEEMQRTYDQAINFPTVYGTMIGPNEFHVTGSLRDWDMDDKLSDIRVPTLVLHGEFDEATDEVVRASREHISDVEYVRIAGASHTPHLEKPDQTIQVFSDFLARHDPH